MGIISKALGVEKAEIVEGPALKKGMTNRSVLFLCRGKKYIMRIPGEGSSYLVNRRQEAAVYKAISGKGICDDIIYIDPDNGYKITEFLEGARVCDPLDRNDVIKCMQKLRRFHDMKLTVDHEFDVFAQIDFYESLWPGNCSVYKDYPEVKEKVFSFQRYIETYTDKKMLAHIDATPDNFLFFTERKEKEKICLIDWEYAGMQDPHIDIAMFAIYSFYNARQIDELIRLYWPEGCPSEIRIKIYCYIAVCGLLWSNWCEYKSALGADLGKYSLWQYRYAREYSYTVKRMLREEAEKWGIK